MIKKILKITGWCLVALVALIILTITGLVWYLSPSKLTPIVEREVNARIDGHLDVNRVELTFWSSFPNVEVTVDTLTLLSHRFDSLSPAQRELLPRGADSLLCVDRLHAGVNLLSLINGDIKLYDVLIDRPRANVVVAPGGIANYDIMKNGEPDTVADSSSGALPNIILDRFRLLNAGPINYVSIPDTLSVSVYSPATNLKGGEDDYRLDLVVNAASPLLEEFSFTPISLGVDGRVKWNPQRPSAVELNEFNVAINEFNATFDVSIDATDTLTVKSGKVSLAGWKVSDIINHLNHELKDRFETLDTDIELNVSATLLKPYCITDSLTLPVAEATLSVSRSKFYFDRIMMDEVSLDVNAVVDGENLDRSVVNVNDLTLKGQSLDVNVGGKATGPIGNPYIDGHVDASLRLNRLPQILLDRLSVKMTGTLTANTNVRMRLNDLTPNDFHKIYMDGKVTVDDLSVATADTLMAAYVHHALFDMGTSRTVQGVESSIDSMLTASIRIDTASVNVPGLTLRSRDMLAALGVMNRTMSSDTTLINPIGGTIRFKSLHMNQQSDSTDVRMRDVETHASLTRYRGQERAPQLNFVLNARRISTRMSDFALMVSKPSINVNAHLITAGRRGDAVASGRQRQSSKARAREHRADTTQAYEVIAWDVNNDFKTLLRRWNVDGNLKSRQALVFTAGFPLRQRASDIDLHFSTDSIVLRSLYYSIGNTRMNVKGCVSNMERALAGRNSNSKLRIDFDIDAPYIDISQLADAAFHETVGDASVDHDYDNEDSYSNVSVETDTTASRPLLIPRNIQAKLNVHADSIQYTDLVMNNFTGCVEIDNSAVNLHDLRASTDVGAASMSALYWAPDTAHMHFGLGMQLNRFHIDRVLSMLPAVDSLLPALNGFAGVINADMAVTTALTPDMDFNMPTLKGAVKLSGDSLVLLDPDTFKMLAKWLIFKDKKHNMIDHMDVEIVVEDNRVEIFPFIFDIDRYKLGVMGSNDLDMNLDYHVSVLKSPIPFKFGINIKGNIDDYKIRFGGAKIKPGKSVSYAIADTTRINLLDQIENVFRRGSMSQESLNMGRRPRFDPNSLQADTLSASDTLLMRQEGMLPPDTVSVEPSVETSSKRKFPWSKK